MRSPLLNILWKDGILYFTWMIGRSGPAFYHALTDVLVGLSLVNIGLVMSSSVCTLDPPSDAQLTYAQQAHLRGACAQSVLCPLSNSFADSDYL
jgi:hypothetical protein